VIVWLLRHGIAEDPSSRATDDVRALTPEGTRRLERAGRTWARTIHGVDVVYASPLLRAQQTARIFAEAVADSMEIETLPELKPSARPLLALERIQADLQAGRSAIAMVGHEPHLGCLLGLLLTGNERTSLPFKKGMLVGVDLDTRTSLLGRLIVAMSTRIAASLSD
jgi:phosphohistidine phosphatase